MSSVNLTVDILCMCGSPASGHGPGKTDHTFLARDAVGPLRPEQELVVDKRTGHFAIHERRVVKVPTPVVGADWSIRVPGNARWLIKSLQAQLLTSAAVANRVVHLTLQDPELNGVYNVPVTGNQVAGSTWQYSAGVSTDPVTFDNASTLCIPYETQLNPQWSIGSLTTGLDAGDQWSNIYLNVEEWLYF